jgi:hypothetical protein
MHDEEVVTIDIPTRFISEIIQRIAFNLMLRFCIKSFKANFTLTRQLILWATFNLNA